MVSGFAVAKIVSATVYSCPGSTDTMRTWPTQWTLLWSHTVTRNCAVTGRFPEHSAKREFPFVEETKIIGGRSVWGPQSKAISEGNDLFKRIIDRVVLQTRGFLLVKSAMGRSYNCKLGLLRSVTKARLIACFFGGMPWSFASLCSS